MKPCRTNRKEIAWLALDALEVPRARKLRAHVETCAGCRRHLEEISTVARKLQAVESGADIQAHEAFHRRLLSALKAEATAWNWPAPLAQWRLNWRVALPVSAGAGLLLLALATLLNRPTVSPPAVPNAQSVPPAVIRKADPLPTLSNYEMVANQSLEKLDELLSRQAERNPPPAPIYRASSLLPESVME